MKLKTIFIGLFCMAVFQNSFAQNYDSVSGATQKEDGKKMNLEQFVKALELKNTCVFSTVNADGTPNAAVFSHIQSRGENILAVGSIADTKTSKINLKKNKIAIMLMVLPEKTIDGFDGAKVVLKYIEDIDKITKLRSKMEESSERTTFFTVEEFLIYH